MSARGVLEQLLARLGARLALALLLAACLGALGAPLIAPQDPYALAALDLMEARLAPGATSADGQMHYWLGTDEQGRDMLSAILYGLRISLAVGAASTALALAIGLLLGLSAAYWRGPFDALVMRLVDLQLSIPALLIALVLLAISGPGLGKIVAALAAVQWAHFASLVRSSALVEANKDYIAAARCLGLSSARIMLRHLLPNCLSPLLVFGAVQLAAAVSLEATLSFLGLGLPVTEPSLGLLIANGFRYFLSGQYWMCMFPGLALLLVLASINVLVDRLREVLDPRAQPR
jgi:peptide/nickel transport system permease protein